MTLGAGAAALVDNSVDRNSNDPRPVLIVTGLVQEARIAAGPGMIVICSSSDPQQLRALLATLDSSTFRGVISFGVAGGLDPSLKSGDVVVATEVLAGDTRFLAGLALNEELIARATLRRRRVVRGGLAWGRRLRGGQGDGGRAPECVRTGAYGGAPAPFRAATPAPRLARAPVARNSGRRERR